MKDNPCRGSSFDDFLFLIEEGLFIECNIMTIEQILKTYNPSFLKQCFFLFNLTLYLVMITTRNNR